MNIQENFGNTYGSYSPPSYESPEGMAWGQDQWQMFNDPQFTNESGGYDWRGALQYFGNPSEMPEADGKNMFLRQNYEPGLGLTDLSVLPGLNSNAERMARNEQLKSTSLDQLYDGNLFSYYLSQRDPAAFKEYMESRFKPDFIDKSSMLVANLAANTLAPGLGSIFRTATGDANLLDYIGIIDGVSSALSGPKITDLGVDKMDYDLGSTTFGGDSVPSSMFGDFGSNLNADYGGWTIPSTDYSSFIPSMNMDLNSINNSLGTAGNDIWADAQKWLKSPGGQIASKFLAMQNPKIAALLKGVSAGGDVANGNIGQGVSGLLGAVGSMYSANKANQGFKSQRNVINKASSDLQSLYTPNSAYAQQMRQELERRDAASGRRSQYGNREVELAARLADSQSRALSQVGNMQQGLTGINQNIGKASAAPWQDLIGLLGTKQGQQAIDWAGQQLSDLF